ncbi:nuclear transport factor 2 family protein [candidate division KSB1 bacterium]
MSTQDYKYAVLQFVEKMNERDFNGVRDMITDDFLFIDSSGITNKGKERCREIWDRYFSLFPDIEFSITHIMQNGNTIAILGNITGTFAAEDRASNEHSWSIPAAWKSVYRDDKVAEIRIYADLEPIRKKISDH